MDDAGIFGNTYDDEDVGTEDDLNNLETILNVSPIPTTRIDKDHPKDKIIGDFNSAIQTRSIENRLSSSRIIITMIDNTQWNNKEHNQSYHKSTMLSR
ncbi:hypothetical protein Tco_0071931 [Tanacetum coccineum]